MPDIATRRYQNAIQHALELKAAGERAKAADWANAALGFASEAGVSRTAARAALAQVLGDAPAAAASRVMTQDQKAAAWKKALVPSEAPTARKRGVRAMWSRAMSDRNPFAGIHPADRL